MIESNSIEVDSAAVRIFLFDLRPPQLTMVVATDGVVQCRGVGASGVMDGGRSGGAPKLPKFWIFVRRRVASLGGTGQGLAVDLGV